MTRRHELDKHHHKLREIRNIMNSMKTLAIMETHKLERFITAHQEIANNIDLIAADFLQFNLDLSPEVETDIEIFILVGSEHGFCGDFNEQLEKMYNQKFTEAKEKQRLLITVGNKLHPLVSHSSSDIIHLPGADIAEEVFTVVEQISLHLSRHPQAASLHVLFHSNSHNELTARQLLPPFQELNHLSSAHLSPPILNMKAGDFFIELTEHYLFSTLHRILYISLMIENQRRIQHLENALQHIDNKNEELARKINSLRQEEIIEEIEVILLNAASD